MYKTDSAEEFLRAIDTCLADPEWRAAAAGRSQQIAASFDKKTFAESVEHIYESVL